MVVVVVVMVDDLLIAHVTSDLHLASTPPPGDLRIPSPPLPPSPLPPLHLLLHPHPPPHSAGCTIHIVHIVNEEVGRRIIIVDDSRHDSVILVRSDGVPYVPLVGSTFSSFPIHPLRDR